MIIPTLRVVTPSLTLCVDCDAERQRMHSHAERGNDQASDLWETSEVTTAAKAVSQAHRTLRAGP
jgi:hypothetical protein